MEAEILPKMVDEVNARFDDKIVPEPNSGCHLWIATYCGDGYGQFSVKGKAVLAHRYAWERCYGRIPHGLCVLHRCDVRSCVNVAHLFLGTNKDNVIDRAIKSRGTKSKKGLPFGVNKTGNGFVAQVKKDGRELYLGYFRTAELAGVAAARAKAELYA